MIICNMDFESFPINRITPNEDEDKIQPWITGDCAYGYGFSNDWYVAIYCPSGGWDHLRKSEIEAFELGPEYRTQIEEKLQGKTVYFDVLNRTASLINPSSLGTDIEEAGIF